MANFYTPSFNGGPLFSGNNFDESMFEVVIGADITPNYITSKNNSEMVQIRSFNGYPYNTYARMRVLFTQLPTATGYSSPVGIWLQRDGFYGFEDYIYISVNLSNYAPGGKFQYRINVYSSRLGSSYDTGYVDTAESALTIDFQVWMRGNIGGGANVDWQVDIAEISVSASGTLMNYGYPGGLDVLPDEWRVIYYGGVNDLYSTQISKLQYNSISRIHNPLSIESTELFGNPSVSLSKIDKTITPLSINSNELFGNLSVASAKFYIFPQSVQSTELFGSPAIIINTVVQSALPAPAPVKEGDIKLIFDAEEQYAEFVLADRDVERDSGFETAVLLTLLTDKRAEAGDPLPDDSGYKGGWWGDSLPVVPDYEMGTKLWLLQRSKTLTEIPAIAKEYLADGFKWMVEDGIIKSVDITVERRRDLKDTLYITLSFMKPEGTTIFYKFYYNWESQILRRQ